MVSLKNKNVKLVAVEKKQIDILYNWQADLNIKYLFDESSHILTKKEFYKKIYQTINRNFFLLIVPIDGEKPIGFINSQGYNKTDGYLYINGFIENVKENKRKFLEGATLFFYYLFDNLSIRKIYAEIYSYNIQYAKILKELGFKMEIKLPEYKFFNGKYHSKYILSLNKIDFYGV